MSPAARTATRDRADQQEQAREAPAGNLPATTEGKPKHPLVAFQEYAQQRMEQLQFALPSHISPDRFTRILMTALQRKPDLLKCTRQSLWNACMLAAQDGLMPDGREGAIVPYGENADGKKVAEIATFMPMIEGLRKKARNSGEISDWNVQIVRARDHFEVVLGDEPRIDHKPYMGAEDPGQIVAAYSIARLKDGSMSRDVMTIRELKLIQAKSRAKNGPWSDATFFPEMCKKTVARRHYKQLPHSSDLDDMIKRDDQAFGLEDRSDVQIEQRQARRVTSVNNAFDQFAGNAIEYDHAADQQHDPETGEVQQDDDGFGGPDEAVVEQQEKPKPAAAEKPKADVAKTEPKKTDAKPKGDPISSGPAKEAAQPDTGGEAGPDTGDAPSGASSSAAGIDHNAREWPPEDVPTDVDEYEMYLDTMIAKATNSKTLQAKFVDDGKLRVKCGVSDQQKSAFITKVKLRMAELDKAAG